MRRKATDQMAAAKFRDIARYGLIFDSEMSFDEFNRLTANEQITKTNFSNFHFVDDFGQQYLIVEVRRTHRLIRIETPAPNGDLLMKRMSGWNLDATFETSYR